MSPEHHGKWPFIFAGGGLVPLPFLGRWPEGGGGRVRTLPAASAPPPPPALAEGGFKPPDCPV